MALYQWPLEPQVDQSKLIQIVPLQPGEEYIMCKGLLGGAQAGLLITNQRLVRVVFTKKEPEIQSLALTDITLISVPAEAAYLSFNLQVCTSTDLLTFYKDPKDTEWEPFLKELSARACKPLDCNTVKYYPSPLAKPVIPDTCCICGGPVKGRKHFRATWEPASGSATTTKGKVVYKFPLCKTCASTRMAAVFGGCLGLLAGMVLVAPLVALAYAISEDIAVFAGILAFMIAGGVAVWSQKRGFRWAIRKQPSKVRAWMTESRERMGPVTLRADYSLVRKETAGVLTTNTYGVNFFELTFVNPEYARDFALLNRSFN